MNIETDDDGWCYFRMMDDGGCPRLLIGRITKKPMWTGAGWVAKWKAKQTMTVGPMGETLHDSASEAFDKLSGDLYMTLTAMVTTIVTADRKYWAEKLQ